MSDSRLLKPDREFIDRIVGSGGDGLKKCCQCAACSAVCELAPRRRPFPRKEMIWAQWGLKDRLLGDPDVWLCHQCGDCSTRCPRNARPADVLAAIRRESVLHYSTPRLLGAWVNQPKYCPLLLAVPAALLGLALLARDPIENALGVSTNTGEKIVFSYWNKLPHWLLIGFFTFFGLLALLAVIVGVARFWRAMEAADSWDRVAAPARRLGSSIVATLKTVLAHNHFSKCATERPRLLSHLCAFYGFIALSVVAIRVLMLAATARFNPLIQDFAYPFNFWNPWRMLANLGGVALVVGCLLMIRDRLARSGQAASTFFDWALPGILLAVALTGFLSEGLHYARMEPQRQGVYFVHLVFVFALLAHLPYSKFAHLTYRTAAMVYGEYSGRNAAATAAASSKPEGEKEARQQAQPTNRQPS